MRELWIDLTIGMTMWWQQTLRRLATFVAGKAANRFIDAIIDHVAEVIGG